MASHMTKALAASVKQLALNSHGLSLELRPPVAEPLQWQAVRFAIFPLIQSDFLGIWQGPSVTWCAQIWDVFLNQTNRKWNRPFATGFPSSSSQATVSTLAMRRPLRETVARVFNVPGSPGRR